jgi:Tol biopolymer transport system component
MSRRPSRGLGVGVAAVVMVGALGAAACAPPSAPPAGKTSRVSVAPGGAQADGGSASTNGSLSADGRYVAFASTASNLIEGDSNSSLDWFVADRSTGEVERVSVTSDGSEVQGIPSPNSEVFATGIGISADGQIVAFASPWNGLVPDDTNFLYLFGLPWFPMSDVFVHDRSTGITERVSVSSDGAQGNGVSGERGGVALSGDGRFVTFQSSASTLVSNDTNESSDIFVRDRWTDETTRVSVSSTGEQAEGGAAGVAMSADGRFVAFTSPAPNLVPGDTNDGDDVFLHDRASGTTKRVSEGIDGTQFHPFSGFYGLSVSGDGCLVAFNSPGPDDGNGVAPGIYLHDCASGETRRVSTEGPVNLVLSRDGRYLAYSRGVTAPDEFGESGTTYDIRMLELATGRVRTVDTGLGGVTPDGNSFSPAVSADGSVVTYSSVATNLVLDDTNGVADVFAFESARR